MKIEIKAPAFPESVADGEVSLWHKQEGDFVQRDELLVEIETDKVVMEVVAPEAGRLDRILVDVGSTIESDALLAELTPGEATDSAEASPAEKTVEKAEAPVPMGPAARQLVDEHGLDASAIKGTGKDGRINKEDVLAHLAERAPAPAPQPTSNAVPPSAAPTSSVAGCRLASASRRRWRRKRAPPSAMHDQCTGGVRIANAPRKMFLGTA